MALIYGYSYLLLIHLKLSANPYFNIIFLDWFPMNMGFAIQILLFGISMIKVLWGKIDLNPQGFRSDMTFLAPPPSNLLSGCYNKLAVTCARNLYTLY